MRPVLPLLAGTLALTAALASPGRAADPATRCQKATVTGLAACVQKVSKAQVACFEKTGYACLAGDQKLLMAFAELDKAIRGGQCPDAAAVEAAGYAPLESDELAQRFQEACVREVGDISQRVFGGPQGPHLAGAGDADRKCLLRAGKEAGKLLGKALVAVGHCVGRSCDGGDLDRTDEKLAKLESKAAHVLEKKCGDLVGLVGQGAAALARETSERTLDATASPCDPIDAGYCMFPFPNDYFGAGDLTSPTGRRLALSSRAMPVNKHLANGQFDPAKWNVLDGFSVGSALIVHDAALDLAMSGAPPITDLAASLEADAPVLLLDAETGEQQLLWTERDSVGATPAEQADHRARRREPRERPPLHRGAAQPEGREAAPRSRRTRCSPPTGTARRPASSPSRRGARTWSSSSPSSRASAWPATSSTSPGTSPPRAPRAARRKLLAMRDDAFDDSSATARRASPSTGRRSRTTPTSSAASTAPSRCRST